MFVFHRFKMQSGGAWVVDLTVKAFRNMFCAAALFHFNFSEINFDNGSRCLRFGVFRHILSSGTGAPINFSFANMLALFFKKYLLLFMWDSSCCYEVYYIINF